MSLENLPANLLRARRRSGLNQAAAAKAAGISRVAYCEMERGRLTPSLETLERIATAIGSTISKLLS